MILKTMPSSLKTRQLKTFDKGDDLCLSWWLEVGTANPVSIHYYGPFDSQVEAEATSHATDKESQVIYSYSRFCQPRQRTIEQNELTIQDMEACPPTFFEVLIDCPRIY